MIKAVLFDFDETLQDRTKAFEGYMDAFMQDFLPDLPKAEQGVSIRAPGRATLSSASAPTARSRLAAASTAVIFFFMMIPPKCETIWGLDILCNRILLLIIPDRDKNSSIFCKKASNMV